MMNRQQKIRFIQALIKGDGANSAPDPIPSWIVNDCNNDPALICEQLQRETGKPARIIEKDGKFYNIRKSFIQETPTWFNNERTIQ